MADVVEFLPVRIGLRQRKLYGGPYMKRPSKMVGVKMAQEIQAYCDISVPTADFSTPNELQLINGLRQVLVMLADNKPVYVGCMGGTGRTGLFMACLMKALGHKDPVAYVREKYRGHAVETKAQEDFIANLDVSSLKWDVQLAALKATLKFWS